MKYLVVFTLFMFSLIAIAKDPLHEVPEIRTKHDFQKRSASGKLQPKHAPTTLRILDYIDFKIEKQLLNLKVNLSDPFFSGSNLLIGKALDELAVQCNRPIITTETLDGVDTSVKVDLKDPLFSSPNMLIGHALDEIAAACALKEDPTVDMDIDAEDAPPGSLSLGSNEQPVYVRSKFFPEYSIFPSKALDLLADEALREKTYCVSLDHFNVSSVTIVEGFVFLGNVLDDIDLSELTATYWISNPEKAKVAIERMAKAIYALQGNVAIAD